MKKKKISKKANLIICAVAFIIMIVYLVFVDSIDNVVAAMSKINIIEKYKILQFINLMLIIL